MIFFCLNLLDGHGLNDYVVVRGIATVGLDACNFVQDLETLVELAEYGVAVGRAWAYLVVVQEMYVVAMDNEELATDGIGHGRLCPAKGAPHVGEARVVLVADGGARALGGVATGTVPVGEVATLDHEILDNTVEGGSIVLALLGQLDKVRGAFAYTFLEEAELHRSVVGFHDGDGFAGLGFVELVEHRVSNS